MSPLGTTPGCFRSAAQERPLPLLAFTEHRDCVRIHRYSKLSLVGAVFGAIWSTPVLAHDIYSNLTDKNGKSCCNKHDCRPAHFRVSPEGVSMLVEGSWLRVPNELVVYRNLMGDGAIRAAATGAGRLIGARTGWVTIPTLCV